ncbi:HEAT repeat domain-containing protein [Stenomitos frigidus]|uniref:HEAT repeat domain-containing protein n=1 Tax=Stenomitos frigidus TaxID=1886765 RepID=UPI0015E72215|nr:HEAT repeat domain-containing protein [Stenomitos frigidus]
MPLITTILFASFSAVLAQNTNDSTKQACAVNKIQGYASRLGTSKLTNSDFEALIRCDAQAVPVLSRSLKSDRSEVRASAAYALGEIASKKQNWNAFDTITKHQELEKDLVVLQILKSYRVEMQGCGNCSPAPLIVRKIASRTRVSSPVVCSLPGIRSILPRCK